MDLFRTILITVLLLFTVNAHSEEIAIIVNLENQSTITVDSVKKIFLGHRKYFSDGTLAIPINVKSSIQRTFNAEVLKYSSNQLKSYWAKSYFTKRVVMPLEINDFEATKELVVSNRNVISYIPARLVDNTVKVIFTVDAK